MPTPPAWTVAETLLALAVAHDLEWTNPSSATAPVVDLSRLITAASVAPQGQFHARNANSVKMKVSNLVYVYTDGQTGLKGGSRQDRELVSSFSQHPGMLLRLAADIRQLASVLGASCRSLS